MDIVGEYTALVRSYRLQLEEYLEFQRLAQETVTALQDGVTAEELQEYFQRQSQQLKRITNLEGKTQTLKSTIIRKLDLNEFTLSQLELVRVADVEDLREILAELVIVLESFDAIQRQIQELLEGYLTANQIKSSLSQPATVVQNAYRSQKTTSKKIDHKR